MFCLGWLSLSQPHSELVLIVKQRGYLSDISATPIFAIFPLGHGPKWILYINMVLRYIQEITRVSW